MQLEDSSVLDNSSHNKPVMAAAAAPPNVAAQESVNGGEMEVEYVNNNSGEAKGREGGGESNNSDDNKISFGGNRWPRQETLALLKIRSDMDAVFRDSSLKGPLWEEVSRKLAELGYHRNAKKCKEKFENVYKYHKRTKESRSSKSEGKTYKFFDQIEALRIQFPVSYLPKPQPLLETTTTATNQVTLPTTRPSDSNTATSYVTTFPSTNPTIISPSPPTNPINTSSHGNNNNNNVPHSLPNTNLFSTTTISTSSSTASDEDLEERYGKKRKWKDYFRSLARKVLAKQEEMQKNFLETIDKREREKVAKYEAWRMQEIARINRENEILVQERSTAAAKDATLIAFLQKLTGQQNATENGNFLQIIPSPPPPPPPPQISQLTQSLLQLQSQPQPQSHMEILQKLSQSQPRPQLQLLDNNNGHSVSTTAPMNSSSRWPKPEVHALIRLRTSLEAKYEENGSKSPMWEEIAAEMQKLGYNRSAKRCKQKWENINKYFKKVKESKKQRREDSKTCPYYHELDALYKEKSKNLQNMKPLMVQPEQQWRPTHQCEQQQQQQPLEEGKESNASDEYEENEEECDEDDDVDEEEDEGASRYEIATNKLSAVDTTVE